MTTGTATALACRDVSVNFGPVAALADVSVNFAEGMIHAVVGQNGAGKTTFARVAAGIVRPDKGGVEIAGREVPVGHVGQARAAGIEIVHQSFALPPSFTVAEAMEFGANGSGSLYTRRDLERRWTRHLESLGVRVKPRERIRDLPVETQQAVEIARALVTDARVLILDEPTAVLSPSGIDNLFERLKVMQANGVTVILILHKIREVLAIADTVTVLRGGKLVEGPTSTAEVDAARLAASIIGSTDDILSETDRDALVGAAEDEGKETEPAHHAGPAILDMRGVSTRPDPEGPALENVALTVGRGEIVGIAGVEGNGQRTLVRALSHLADLTGGTITLSGVEVTHHPLSARRANGLRVIPFERNSEGLSLSSALWENWSARALLRDGVLKLISPARLRRACTAALQVWDVRFNSPNQPAGSLSGGNAQKLILAREVDDEATLIIAAQPTRGLDVGATAFVWRSLREARDRGCGILLISSDLDELFDISDRIVVMLSGRINGEFSHPYHLGEIGAAMTGADR
ncbi:MAG: ATP-binding cassette domain-containing protein [Bauldia sp.]|uniref:ABC transporter ATP-binding protein n=1 Tax=Bauldia sp. TaxID=2575872 RepID=UPI001DE96E34|nr:ATP-binding cassette domain-containing protein [Bauldia sp.]MCB1496822.1 ATP-binding cassette domain-containing protein [Bauldia sp.]